MPSGDSLADRKPIAKTPLRRAIALFSPLLILSLGLHGLVMLLPLAEKEEIVEEVPELPEPIQVSELPELDIPAPESASAPVFSPAPAPKAPPATPPSAPVVQPPVVVTQPKPQESPGLTPQTRQESETPNPPVQKPEKNQEPVEPQTSEPVESSSIVRTYKQAGTADQSFLEPFQNDLTSGTYSDGESIGYDALRKGKLTFALPAGDNCFREAKPVGNSSVMLPTSLGVIVSNDGDKGFIRYATVVLSTGYPEANNLINDAMVDEKDKTVYNSVDAWMREAVGSDGFPFAEKGNDLAYVIFNVEVTFEGHSCPTASPS